MNFGDGGADEVVAPLAFGLIHCLCRIGSVERHFLSLQSLLLAQKLNKRISGGIRGNTRVAGFNSGHAYAYG